MPDPSLFPILWLPSFSSATGAGWEGRRGEQQKYQIALFTEHLLCGRVVLHNYDLVLIFTVTQRREILFMFYRWTDRLILDFNYPRSVI